MKKPRSDRATPHSPKGGARVRSATGKITVARQMTFEEIMGRIVRVKPKQKKS